MLKLTPVLLAATLLAGAANAQTLELNDCRISAGPGAPSMKARCGSLLRPLDPSGTVAGDIALRVVIVPALNLTPEPDPFVPIAGGPGQGSVAFYTGYSRAFEDVRRNRDILLIDQRGTGESATMACDFDEDLIEGEYSTELTIKYTHACLDQLPYDPRFFTTSVAVTDIEAVREALAYPALNLYGISYGSRVAQHFARRYPDSTRTVIIDGVVPPQLSLGPEIATEGQKAINRILTRCKEDETCNDHFPNIDEVFARIVAEVKETAIPIQVPNPSTGRPEDLDFGEGELAAAIRLLAYHPNSIALIPLLINEAGKGNYVPLGSQFMMTMIALTQTISMGMHNAVMCTEDVPFYDPTTIDYDGLEASYMGTFQLEALLAICSVWPQGPLDDAFKAPLETDIPVLLLSGDADPITPPRYADLAAVDLSNATHLVGKNQGHGQIAVGCTPRLVAEFIKSADPQTLDSECLQRSFVMPYFLDFSGPNP